MAFRYLENLSFGEIYQIRYVVLLIVGAALDFGRGSDKFALNVFLGDDFGVEYDVRRRTDLLRQSDEVLCAADGFELLVLFEVFVYGVYVYRVQGGVER